MTMGNLMACFDTHAEAIQWAATHCDADTYEIEEVYEENGDFIGYGVYCKPEYC